MNFGDRLKNIRCRADLTQKEFGEIGGVLQQAQYKYEKGSRMPDAGYIQKLLNAGFDMHYVLTGESLYKLTGRKENNNFFVNGIVIEVVLSDGYYVANCNQIHLVAESNSLDVLLYKISYLIPELIKENNLDIKNTSYTVIYNIKQEQCS